MRFAAASKNNASNYATAGAHIINASTDIQQAIANRKPDYTGIAITAMDAASLEKQAALKAETAVNTAGLKAVADIKQAKLTADSRVAAAQSMADAKINVTEMDADVQELKDKHRMAGKLSALGALAAKTAIKRKKVDPPKFDGVDLSTDIAETTAKIAKLQKEIDAFNSGTEVATEPTAPTGASNLSISTDSDTDLRQMQSLINDGYSLTSAAAIVGNTRHESGQYRHHEELAPNAYGTRGAGWFQWTDLDSTGGRRTNFENFANQMGVAPNTFEANNGFMLNEMRSGGQWLRGSREEFMGIDDLEQATNYFSNIYLRPAPATANNEARLSYARDSLARYQELLNAQN